MAQKQKPTKRISRGLGESISVEDRVDLVMAKANMFDLMLWVNEINSPSVGGIGLIETYFVFDTEDLFFFKQPGSVGVSFKVPIIKDGVCLSASYDHRNLVVNLQSGPDVFEEMSTELVAIENAIQFAKEKEVKRKAAKEKARELLTDEERELLNLKI